MVTADRLAQTAVVETAERTDPEVGIAVEEEFEYMEPEAGIVAVAAAAVVGFVEDVEAGVGLAAAAVAAAVVPQGPFPLPPVYEELWLWWLLWRSLFGWLGVGRDGLVFQRGRGRRRRR